jgi:hypothetical protein
MVREQNGTIDALSKLYSIRHGRDRPGHPDPVKRRALPIGITGTSPVMTSKGNVQGGYECNRHRRVIVR